MKIYEIFVQTNFQTSPLFLDVVIIAVKSPFIEEQAHKLKVTKILDLYQTEIPNLFIEVIISRIWRILSAIRDRFSSGT